MGERAQKNRWRCLTVGCNPVLHGRAGEQHAAKWPVRSAKGKAKARERNRTGYYDQYNVSVKSRYWRGIEGHLPAVRYEDAHPFSSEALGQD